jgi:hypothetical protein
MVPAGAMIEEMELRQRWFGPAKHDSVAAVALS